MAEDKKQLGQPEKPQKSQQPDEATLAGAQGNTGQYGQGQYDSEGNPDPHGPQAKQLRADESIQDTKAEQAARKKATQPQAPQD